MIRNVSTVLGLLTLSVVFTLFRATTDVPRLISPQGCRMSWMSPSYLLQSEFNGSWTTLAGRYSLWLYREVGWEPNQAMGLPVLFIPGNAGSSHQVRSIASSAARQYFSSPFSISEEFTKRGSKPIDFYAVEFNEDLSAFHGPTLDSQITYASAAIEYILYRYPPNTQIIVMGHSMGGVVGTALLPSERVKALITMSTPHTFPPARFDARIEEIYDRNRIILREDKTPILSICGGATDMMIPSESCILPLDTAKVDTYRRTVFTSALEGAWTGVGHREMVWCHQVRWRVARAALELGATQSAEEYGQVLDRWLSDGSLSRPIGDTNKDLRVKEYETVPGDLQLVLNGPKHKTYLLRIPSIQDGGGDQKFALYVSRGSVLGVSPHYVLDLRVSVHVCTEDFNGGSVLCDSLEPVSLELLPAPVSGKSFPIPDEGTDESEGIVFFEADTPKGVEGWVGVTIDAGDRAGGWIAGGFGHTQNATSDVGLWGLLLGGIKIPLAHTNNPSSINLPYVPATALLVYRLTTTEYGSCTAPFISPLLIHTSQVSEKHYYRLGSGQPIFLHTHSSGPYVPSLQPTVTHGLDLTIHSLESSCSIAEVHLSVDWWTSVGRIGMRYLTTLLGWGVGIVSLLLFHSWGLEGRYLSVTDSLGFFVKWRMPTLMVAGGMIALFPLGSNHYLGIGNELGLLRALLAMLLIGVAAGVVCISWWLLVMLMWPFNLVRRAFIQRKPENVRGVRRRTVISMALVLALIFLFVPWQVAFLGCWVTQFSNCITISRQRAHPGSVPTLANSPNEPGDKENDSQRDNPGYTFSRPSGVSAHALRTTFGNAYNQNSHMLLLMTWLLPLAAPVLAVWVRTVQTAGYTTPFDGDHNVFKVLPMLVLVDLLGRGRPLETSTGWRCAARWGWAVVAITAFLMGGRRAYVIYDAVIVQVAILSSFQLKAWVYG